MLTQENIIEKVKQLRRLDDLVALNHYVDYLLLREKNEKTELGQALIKGLENVLAGRTYPITCAQDVLKVADEIQF